MEIEFASSPRSDIGIEWELAIVNHTSGELAPAAPEILGQLGAGDSDGFPQVTAEFLTNTVEFVSGPHNHVRNAVRDLTGMIDRVRAVTDTMGVELMCAGTHPFSQWFQQHVTPKERYAKLVERTQWWGRQMMIWGVHMHVGIENRDKVLPILNGLLTYYPLFQALSASSPFWVGETTGYASNRALLFQQLPTAGLPPQLREWADYEQVIGDLKRVGVITDYTEAHWDVRPSPKWGTIELRFCDGLATAEEVGALGALAQCLVEELSAMLDNGEAIPTLQPWFVRENKWRTARYGLDAIIIVDAAGNEGLVTDQIRETLARLQPIANRLGCLPELDAVNGILTRGASYQRQLAVAAANGGSLKAVVASLVSELRDGF